jgi:hypothetical protein
LRAAIRPPARPSGVEYRELGGLRRLWEPTLAEDTEQPERITRADLDLLRRELRAALEHSTPTRAKTVLQAMIDGIRVDARDRIEPTFRVPAVREPYGSANQTRFAPRQTWASSCARPRAARTASVRAAMS